MGSKILQYLRVGPKCFTINEGGSKSVFVAINKGGSKVCSNPDGNPVGNVQAAQILGGERRQQQYKIETEQLLRKYKHLQITIRCPWKRQHGVDFATFLLQKKQTQSRSGSVQ